MNIIPATAIADCNDEPETLLQHMKPGKIRFQANTMQPGNDRTSRLPTAEMLSVCFGLFAGVSVSGKDKVILGLDPGTSVMGYGIISVEGSNISLLQFGVIHLNKYASHELKLKKIFERVTSLLDDYIPDDVALEAPFYGKNVQSMLKLGRAQGVAMAAALSREIPITEYAPKKVKQSVTGNGNASKEQVAAMLKTLLVFNEDPKLLDATDALAVALCHHFQGGKTVKSFTNWNTFLSKNPSRLK